MTDNERKLLLCVAEIVHNELSPCPHLVDAIEAVLNECMKPQLQQWLQEMCDYLADPSHT